MALLSAPYMRPIIYSMEAILANDLNPFAELKYLLEEILILGIPKGLLFVEPDMFHLKDCIWYDFTVKHSLLINGEVKTLDIKFLLTISCGKVTLATITLVDNTTEIYKSFDEFGSIYNNYIDVSLLVKEKIHTFLPFTRF
jgi:hypothetical protein